MSSSRTTRRTPSHDERGVVLIIALVMLVVVSLLATFSIRNALSTEGVAGNVRTTQLANQAAEIALRYCEDAVVNYIKIGTPLPGSPALALQNPQIPPLGVSTANWDGTRTGVFVVPSASVNTGSATFSRMPECLAERLSVVNAVAVVSLTEIAPAAFQQHVFWGSLLLALAIYGPGPWSLERVVWPHLLRRRAS